MPRQARVQSVSCVYHVMLRGVNKQQIFEDDDDYAKFPSSMCACDPEDEEYESYNDEGDYDQSPEYS